MKDNNIKIDLIRIDGGTQPRAAIVESLVSDYAEHVDALPPLSVFHDGKDYWLADGFHRYHAHRRAGSKTVPTSVHKGTQRDAILYSLGANAAHGLRRTNEDKRHAVETMLHDPEWAKWSDRKIAEQCQVSHNFVGDVRGSICNPITDSKQGDRAKMRTVERGGKTYQQNVTNIGAKKKPAPAPADDTPPEYAGGDEPDDNELAVIAERERLDAQTIEKLLASDDALATAHAEIKRLNAALARMTGERDQYMNRCNELKRQVKAMKRAAA